VKTRKEAMEDALHVSVKGGNRLVEGELAMAPAV
jgi:hypothetical protein